MKVGLYSAALWIILWKGNEAVSNGLDVKMSWARTPLRRLTFGIFCHLIYTFLATFLINYAVYLIYGWNENILTLQGLMNYSFPAIVITIVIASVLTAREFFLAWRQLAIEKEKMEKEVINSKYEVLKSQVNPHFLFNSLNVLTSLVYKDADLSASFIKKLADVYRYVLDVKDRQVVDLKEELAFIESYAFLLKMRHSTGLNIDIHTDQLNGEQVAPLSLQMLVENAVKHNRISHDEPLNIVIDRAGDFIQVKNNLQRKQNIREKTPEVGLQNIIARYQFLSDKEIQVEDDGSFFKVKLPLLRMEI